MKKVVMGKVLVVAFVLLFVGSGCEEGFTPAQLQALAAEQEVLQQQVETLQASAVKMTEDLTAAGIVDQNVVAVIAKVNEEADRIQAQIAVIAQALQGVPLTGDSAQDFIAQLHAANAASGGFNPYVVDVGVGLSVLSLVLGWLAKRKASEAAAEKAEKEFAQVKYQAHKQGVERTMKELSVSSDSEVQAVETQLYANIGEARAKLGV